jgi:hypothetical protein
MQVRLPSGYVAELEAPPVRALLAGDGTTAYVAAATWADERVCCDDLDPGDLYAVALWGVGHIAEDADAVRLALQARYFGGLPSDRVGFADRVLAFEFDDLFTPEPEAAPGDPESDSDCVVVSTPIPEEEQ